MSLETPHLNLSISIYVDGALAAEVTKEDAPLFQEAYRRLFPTATIESFTVLQLAKKRKKAEREAQETPQEGLEVE
jgi:hypothetical protein